MADAPADRFALAGSVAFVTGASAGLGAHFARTLADAGARVALGARRVERCRGIARELEADGAQALALELDVTDLESVRAALDTVEDHLGFVDVLVNNAGVVVTRPLLEQTEADWDRVLETDLKGAWLVAQETSRRLVAAKRGGSIINIASIVAQRAGKGLAGYAAAKAGLVHLTRVMAVELARHAIRVNALAPGYIETDMNREFLAGEQGQRMMRRIPQRRFGRPSDLDGALLLLASGASDWMTGSVITVDGGHSVDAL